MRRCRTGRPLRARPVGPKVYLVVGDLGYTVAARFNREREAAVSPIAKAFVASLRIEGG